jgi:hypothetical protein
MVAGTAERSSKCPAIMNVTSLIPFFSTKGVSTGASAQRYRFKPGPKAGVPW